MQSRHKKQKIEVEDNNKGCAKCTYINKENVDKCELCNEDSK